MLHGAHPDVTRVAPSGAHEMLRRGGVLVVAAPNMAALQARLGGRTWFHLDVPRHRTILSYEA